METIENNAKQLASLKVKDSIQHHEKIHNNDYTEYGAICMSEDEVNVEGFELGHNDDKKLCPNEMNEVPLYDSSKSIDENDLTKPEAKEPKPKEKRNWRYVSEFANAESARSALEKEDTWSIYKRTDTADGMKWVYRCNKVKLRDTQCVAQVYHLFKNDSDEVLEFRTDGVHNHDAQIQSAEAKQRLEDEIGKLLKLKQKPNEIMHSLSEIEGLVLPSKRKLIYIIAKLKMDKYGPPTISMQELSNWLQNHSGIPEDEHESFVLCFETNIEVDEPYFRFIITTRYLLDLAKHRQMSHADTTYKCIWQGFPVFMVGTTDYCKTYHAFGLAVCSNEKTDDFHFVFKGIKEGLLRVAGYEMIQKTIVCDAAFPIINAFIEVYGSDVVVIMCWYHAKTAMEEHLTIVKEANRQRIMEDIEFLHIASSEEIFRNAVKLFVDKWEKEEPEYLEYFRMEWIQKHPNWYLGAAEFTPCHNNALESSNRYLKASQMFKMFNYPGPTNTIRIRHPLPHFLRVASDTVHKWSKRYVIGLKSFALERSIDTKLWTEGYQWAKSNVKAKIISQNDETLTVSVNATVALTGNPGRKDVITFHSSIIQSEVIIILEEEKKDAQSIKMASQSSTEPITAKRQKKTNGKPKKRQRKTYEEVAVAQSSQSTVKSQTSQSTVKSSHTVKSKSSQSAISTVAQSSQSQSSQSTVKSQTSQLAVKSSHTVKSKSSQSAVSTVAQSSQSSVSAVAQSSQLAVSIVAQSPQSAVSAEIRSFQEPNLAVPSTVSKEFEAFEKYKRTFLQWIVTISKKPDGLKEGRCNCPAFLKEYMCKHVIGLSIRMKYVSAPAEGKTVAIGQKRKRGRPAKNKPALMIQ